MMPVLPSSFARRMSAVVRTGMMRSALSEKCRFQPAMLRIVPSKFSHTEQVQFAAVSPPAPHVLEHRAREIRDDEPVDDDKVVVQALCLRHAVLLRLVEGASLTGR